MGILSIVLLTVAATADSLTIGFNYGVKQVRINNASNLFIAFLCLLGTLGAMLVGRLLGSAIPQAFADSIGAAALLGFGLYMLVRALLPCAEAEYAKNPETVDKDNSKVIELRESLLVGILLSLNNMGLGIGAGIAGVSVLITPPLCAAASFMFIKLGCFLGGIISGVRLSKALELLSAGFVLALGVMALL